MNSRITAIGLERRRDRWEACEKHLRSVLPPEVEFDIMAGSDAKMAADRASDKVAALESSFQCKVYRGWPITEVSDVRRCFPSLAGQSDAMAWVGYERAVARAFRSDRSRLYVDFFMRHVSFGDIGAALSHLRVAERAHAEQLDLQIVFEDDSRPTADAVPRLLEEIDKLRRHGVAWDLIYLHSAHYGRTIEPPVELGGGGGGGGGGATAAMAASAASAATAETERSALYHAGHRRVCHAYALSRSGCRKIATCGLRDSVFSIDDFLSALHAGHPRPDLMALPCVRRARGERLVPTELQAVDNAEEEEVERQPEEEEEQEEEQEEATEGFVGLTFRDDAGLCVLPSQMATSASGAAAFASLDSDSKVGHGSAVLLGDAGVLTLAAQEEAEASAATDAEGTEPEEEAEEQEEADGEAVAGRVEEEDAAEVATRLKPTPIAWESLAGDRLPPVVEAELAARSFCLVRMPAADIATLLRAEASAAAFFGRPLSYKRDFVGKGGRRGDLMLWGCGYGAWPHREQWHAVCGAADAMEWPAELIRGGEKEHGDANSDGGDGIKGGGGGEGGGGEGGDDDVTACSELRGAEHLLRRVALASLAACEGAAASKRAATATVASESTGFGGDPASTPASRLSVLRSTCEGLCRGTDPSVLDAFWYPIPEGSETGGSDERGMAAHTDPGVLTLTRASEVPGLEIWDQTARQSRCRSGRSGGGGASGGGGRGAWVPLEALAAADEVLVFAGEQLEAASKGRIRAARHRVVVQPAPTPHAAPTPACAPAGDNGQAISEATQVGRQGQSIGRNSVVFELRAPDAFM